MPTKSRRLRKVSGKVFAAGLAAIVTGFIMLAASDVTVAPILLVLGYCVLVPLSFL